ncbi:serine acetyltransferase, partial [Butyricicoccus sp. 1XD8-22]
LIEKVLINNNSIQEKEASSSADEIVIDLINQFPRIRKVLQTDIEAAYNGDPATTSTEEILFSYPSILAISIHRIANVLYNSNVPIIPRIMSEYAHQLTGIDIHPGASIGEYFFIDHGTGVVIGETCTIGKNVKIYQGVTLGAKSFPLDEDGNPIKGIKRHPDIEDNVVIYAGAT